MLFFCQAEYGIGTRVRSRGLGDVYKGQADTVYGSDADLSEAEHQPAGERTQDLAVSAHGPEGGAAEPGLGGGHYILLLLYTSDAADERLCVDLRRRLFVTTHNQSMLSLLTVSSSTFSYTD